MDSPETYASEQSLLIEIQTAHAVRLRETGILAKALEIAGFTDELSVQSRLLMSRQRDELDQDIFYTELRLTRTTTGPTGMPCSQPRFVRIAQTFAGLTLPVSPFTDHEAGIVRDMIDGLGEARDMGILTHLSPGHDNVSNPRHGLMRMPSKPPSETQ